MEFSANSITVTNYGVFETPLLLPDDAVDWLDEAGGLPSTNLYVPPFTSAM